MGVELGVGRTWIFRNGWIFSPLLLEVTHPNHVLCVQLLLGFVIADFHGTS